MSLEAAVTTDRQLARLLQIGVVLEELVGRDADRGAQAVTDPDVRAVLTDTSREATTHRSRLESLLAELDAAVEEDLTALVEAQYTSDVESDGVLYEQLANVETAYKFFDDLLSAVESSDATYSIDRDRLVAQLERIRADEKDGVETVTELMDR